MNTEQDKTELESKAWYQRAWDLLSDYKQKSYTATIFHGKRKEYTGISLFSPVERIGEDCEHIRLLLAGMGFSVSFNKNEETITIS